MRGIGTRTAQHGKSRVDLTTRVPRRLFLSIHDARVQITFHATPWESQREPYRGDHNALLGAATQEWDHAIEPTSPGMPSPTSGAWQNAKRRRPGASLLNRPSCGAGNRI